MKAKNQTGHPPFFRRGLLDRFIIVPEHHLIFCYIEKNGCTSFNRLFMNIRGQGDESRVWFRNSLAKFGMTPADLVPLMTNASWHKALFYRDPLERFVSAYRSKCEGGHDRDGEMHCERAFGSKNASFAEAVQSFVKYGGSLKTDAHFTRQVAFCGGLESTLQHYDTVELLEASTAHDKVADMLRKVGVDPTHVKEFEILFPPGETHYARGADNSVENIPGVATAMANHITNSHAKTRAYYEKIPPIHAARLAGYFMPDYRLFRIPVPEWIELVDEQQNLTAPTAA